MKQHLRGWLAGTAWLLAAASGACSTAETPANMMTSPVGGTAPTGAGAPSVSAGSPAPAAGGTVAPSTGGTVAGGAAGMVASAAGTGATAGGGAAPAGGSDMSCGAASTLPGPMLHDMAKGFLIPKAESPMSPCAFGSCHTEKLKKAQLVLDLSITDLKATLVDKPSCEAPALKLVASGGGDAALQKSWLWLKLTAPADASDVLTSNPAWGTPGNCGQMSGQDYGVRMPFGAGAWEDNKKAAVKAWICAGAPGAM